jgi:hypothetical protein
MDDLVSANQNAFIRGRSIHDNYKFIQRAAVLYRKRKIPRILLKLDISKAFDTLSWLFLLDVMQALGFGNTWRRWITSTQVADMLNHIKHEAESWVQAGARDLGCLLQRVIG